MLPVAREPRIPGPAGQILMMSPSAGPCSSGGAALPRRGDLQKALDEKRATPKMAPSPIITRRGGGESYGAASGSPATDPDQDPDFYGGPWLTMLEQLQLPPFDASNGAGRSAMRLRFSISFVLQKG